MTILSLTVKSLTYGRVLIITNRNYKELNWMFESKMFDNVLDYIWCQILNITQTNIPLISLDFWLELSSSIHFKNSWIQTKFNTQMLNLTVTIRLTIWLFNLFTNTKYVWIYYRYFSPCYCRIYYPHPRTYWTIPSDLNYIRIIK
jgi:hypothetical protein